MSDHETSDREKKIASILARYFHGTYNSDEVVIIVASLFTDKEIRL